MTTLHVPALRKFLPQPLIRCANWPVLYFIPPPITAARSSFTVSSLSYGHRVAGPFLVRNGRVSSSQFPDHNLAKTQSSNGSLKTACHSTLQDVIQIRPVVADRKHEAASSDRALNEEAEGELKAPIMHLRSILHLWDAHTDLDTNAQQLLIVADYLERFGLDIYFREEIKSILDKIFRIWTDSSFGITTLAAYGLEDLKSCALAFYLLRSHEYEVSPSLFRFYQKVDGKFYQHAGDETAPAPDVIDLLNLHRASGLRFRRDGVLQEAFDFASAALQTLLDEAKESSDLSEKTLAEIYFMAMSVLGKETSTWHNTHVLEPRVRYRLKYPWILNLKMMETRQTIANFQGEAVAEVSRLSAKATTLMLTLATQQVNDYISVLREKFSTLQKWTEESGLDEQSVRPRMILLPFGLSLAYTLPPLPKYAHAVEFNAKVYYILTILDDLFEVGADVEHLQVFMEAIRRWDPSLLQKLPANQGPMSIPVFFKEIYDLTNYSAQKASLWHGIDRLPAMIDHWMCSLNIYLKERLWVETAYTPPLQEYVNDYAKVSFAAESGAPLAYYSLPWETVSPEFLQSRPDMRVIHPIGAGGRFLNDARSFKWERAQFEEAKGYVKPELIDMLLMENPTLTEKDAIQVAEALAESALQEATEEILCSKVPYRGVKDVLLANFRCTNLLYYYVDGLRTPGHALVEFMEPIPPVPYEELGLEPYQSQQVPN